MNTPDIKTDQKDLVGTNIPEFFEALKGAASMALGYYWAPMEVWRNEQNKREFTVVQAKDSKIFRQRKKDWKRIVTVKPHPAGFSK